MPWTKVSEKNRVKLNLLLNQSFVEEQAGRKGLARRLFLAAEKKLAVAEAQEYAEGNNPWKIEEEEEQ